MEELIDNYNKRTQKLLNDNIGKPFEEAKSNILKSLLSFQHYISDLIGNIEKQKKIHPSEIDLMKTEYRTIEKSP